MLTISYQLNNWHFIIAVGLLLAYWNALVLFSRLILCVNEIVFTTQIYLTSVTITKFVEYLIYRRFTTPSEIYINGFEFWFMVVDTVIVTLYAGNSIQEWTGAITLRVIFGVWVNRSIAQMKAWQTCGVFEHLCTVIGLISLCICALLQWSFFVITSSDALDDNVTSLLVHLCTIDSISVIVDSLLLLFTALMYIVGFDLCTMLYNWWSHMTWHSLEDTIFDPSSDEFYLCARCLHTAVMVIASWVYMPSHLPIAVQMAMIVRLYYSNSARQQYQKHKNILNRFPIVPASSSETCGICLEDFIEDEAVTQLPCRHVFHSRCVRKWLIRNSVCPTCRRSTNARIANFANNAPNSNWHNTRTPVLNTTTTTTTNTNTSRTFTSDSNNTAISNSNANISRHCEPLNVHHQNEETNRSSNNYNSSNSRNEYINNSYVGELREEEEEEEWEWLARQGIEMQSESYSSEDSSGKSEIDRSDLDINCREGKENVGVFDDDAYCTQNNYHECVDCANKNNNGNISHNKIIISQKYSEHNKAHRPKLSDDHLPTNPYSKHAKAHIDETSVEPLEIGHILANTVQRNELVVDFLNKEMTRQQSERETVDSKKEELTGTSIYDKIDQYSHTNSPALINECEKQLQKVEEQLRELESERLQRESSQSSHVKTHNTLDVSNNETCANQRCSSYNTSLIENVTLHEDAKTATKLDNMQMCNSKESVQDLFIDSPLLIFNNTKRKNDAKKRKRDDDDDDENNNIMDSNSKKSDTTESFSSTTANSRVLAENVLKKVKPEEKNPDNTEK